MIDADEAVVVDHLLALLRAEAGDDVADIFEGAGLLSGTGVSTRTSSSSVEQPPSRFSSGRSWSTSWRGSSRRGRGHAPLGMVEPGVDALAALLAFGQMLEQDAAGDVAGIVDREPHRARYLLRLAEEKCWAASAGFPPSSRTMPW